MFKNQQGFIRYTAELKSNFVTPFILPLCEIKSVRNQIPCLNAYIFTDVRM